MIQQQMTLLESNAFDKGNIKSFLFCAVELNDNRYSRTKYAEFTREINKRLFAPTVILFRAGDHLTVAFADRRPDKTDEDRDVLGQVTLIKDIRLNNPHRAHLDILSELSLEACVQWMNDKKKTEKLRRSTGERGSPSWTPRNSINSSTENCSRGMNGQLRKQRSRQTKTAS